jgi:hypothetical protein
VKKERDRAREEREELMSAVKKREHSSWVYFSSERISSDENQRKYGTNLKKNSFLDLFFLFFKSISSSFSYILILIMNTDM